MGCDEVAHVANARGRLPLDRPLRGTAMPHHEEATWL